MTNPTPASGDPGITSEGFARASGLVFYCTVTTSTISDRCQVGFDAQTTGGTDRFASAMFFRESGALRVYDEAAQPLVEAYAELYKYEVAIVLRSVGAFYYIKGGLFTNWELVWVGVSEASSPMYARILINTLAGLVTTHDTMRVSQLSAPWTDDYGIATDRLAGARSAGDTFTHEADCLLEYTVDTLPTSTNRIRVALRRQDADNYWHNRVESTGQVNLYEVVSGSPALRAASGAGVASAGSRVVIIADDEAIKVYTDNALLFTYSSAVNFKTETAGALDDEGGGSVSDIVSWPRTLSGSAKDALGAVANA